MIDFETINRAALAALPAILRRLLPDGRIIGGKWISRNPTRADRRPGSFKINLRTGRWADFATGDKGGRLALRLHRELFTKMQLLGLEEKIEVRRHG